METMKKLCSECQGAYDIDPDGRYPLVGELLHERCGGQCQCDHPAHPPRG